MIDAWSDMEAIRSILVAVSTFGHVPSEGMDKYMSILKRNRRYDLNVLSLPSHNPFKNTSKNTNYVLLNFCDNPRLFESPWESVFLHRKVLVLIGLVHCPSNPDLDVAHQDFLTAAKKFPHAIMKRCLAFEPLDSQQDLMERQDLVMVPNADTKKLQFYMNTLVMDVIERLLCEMMEAARALSSSQDLPYILYDKPIIQDASRKRRLLPGRISKLTADYSLLCGIVQDSKDLYRSAIEATKSAGDLICRGAALEGLACCDPDESFENRVALMKKAIRNYERRAETESLRIEAYMKLARFAASQNHSVDSFNYLSRAFELSGSVAPKDRISLVIECAILSHSQGAKRRCGMFIREAALLHSQSQRWQESFALSLLYSSVYGLDGSSSSLPWRSLQVQILPELVASARATKRFDFACSYMIQLLTKVRSSIQQRDIVSDLCKIVPLVPKTQRILMPGIPVITCFSMVALDAQILPKSRRSRLPPSAQAAGKEDEDVFIFRPSAACQNVSSKSPAVLDICLGQLLHFDICIRNPLLIELPLSSLCVQCRGSEFESFPISALLKPLEQKVFRVPILPLSPGFLALTEVWARAFDIDTYHPLEKIWEEPASFRVCQSLPLLKAEVQGEYRGYFGQTLSIPFTLCNAGDVSARDVDIRFEHSDLSSAVTLTLDNGTGIELDSGQSSTVVAIIESSSWKVNHCGLRVSYAADKTSEMFRDFSFVLPVTIDSGLSVRSFEVQPYAQYQFFTEPFSENGGPLAGSSLGPNDCVIVCEIVNDADSRFSVAVPGCNQRKYEIECRSSERLIFPFRRRSFGAKTDACIAQTSISEEAESNFGEILASCREALAQELVLHWTKCIKPIASGKTVVPLQMITPLHFRYIIPDPFYFQFELNGIHRSNQSEGAAVPANAVSLPVSPAFHNPHSHPDASFFVTGGNHHSFPRGEFVAIRIILSIRRSTPMKMNVLVRPSYQDSSGQFDYDISHRLLWKGAWDHTLDFIEPDSSAHLDLNLCFIALGKFMFELVCKCEQPECSPIMYYCSLPLLVVTFDNHVAEQS